jgi:hypothetical protein
MHHDGSFGDAQPCAAQLGGHGDPQPSGRGHCRVELFRKARGLIAVVPVSVRELCAHLAHRNIDFLLQFAKGDFHEVP